MSWGAFLYPDTRLHPDRPDKPIEYAYIESFNGRLRDKCLNAEMFLILDDARTKLAKWIQDYNKVRPHTSLGDIPPSEFADQWTSRQLQEIEILNHEVVQLTG